MGKKKAIEAVVKTTIYIPQVKAGKLKKPVKIKDGMAIITKEKETIKIPADQLIYADEKSAKYRTSMRKILRVPLEQVGSLLYDKETNTFVNITCMDTSIEKPDVSKGKTKTKTKKSDKKTSKKSDKKSSKKTGKKTSKKKK